MCRIELASQHKEWALGPWGLKMILYPAPVQLSSMNNKTTTLQVMSFYCEQDILLLVLWQFDLKSPVVKLQSLQLPHGSHEFISAWFSNTCVKYCKNQVPNWWLTNLFITNSISLMSVIAQVGQGLPNPVSIAKKALEGYYICHRHFLCRKWYYSISFTSIHMSRLTRIYLNQACSPNMSSMRHRKPVFFSGDVRWWMPLSWCGPSPRLPPLSWPNVNPIESKSWVAWVQKVGQIVKTKVWWTW